MNERQTSPWGRARCALWLLGAGVAVLLALPAVARADARATQGSAAAAAADAAQAVDVVILADESGSMQQFPNETQGEQQAATQIVQEEWSTQSQVAIYGFGSAPPGAPTQAAIDQYCGPTQLTDAGRARLAQCAAEIKPRTQAQGYNTDFAAALVQAKTVLGAAPPGSLPLVFILTDGKLDVGPDVGTPLRACPPRSPMPSGTRRRRRTSRTPRPASWVSSRRSARRSGRSASAARTRASCRYSPAAARKAGAPPALGSIPSAAIVPPGDTGTQETEAIQSKVLGAFANARCAVLDQVSWFPLPAGVSVTKTVTISELATFASLIVDKGDPRVVVSYTDPASNKVSDNTGNGQPSGSFPDGTSYALGGGGQSPLESLRLTDPDPGNVDGDVHRPARRPGADGRPGGAVAGRGAAGVRQPAGRRSRSSLPAGGPAHGPLQARPGQRARRTRRRSFAVTWPGGTAVTVPARLDVASGDFTAQPLIPAGAGRGSAHVTVTAASPGVQGQAAASFPVRPGGGLTVTLDLPRGKRVAPGASVTANATIDTNGAPATSIVFSLGGLSDGVDATIARPSGAIQVSSGRQTIPVTISFGKPNRLGPALGTIRWAPAGQGTPAPSDWLAFDSLDVDIEYPAPPFYEQPGWLAALAAVLLAVVVFFLGRWWIHRDDSYLNRPARRRISLWPTRCRAAESKYGTPNGGVQPPPDG